MAYRERQRRQTSRSDKHLCGGDLCYVQKKTSEWDSDFDVQVLPLSNRPLQNSLREKKAVVVAGRRKKYVKKE